MRYQLRYIRVLPDLSGRLNDFSRRMTVRQTRARRACHGRGGDVRGGGHTGVILAECPGDQMFRIRGTRRDRGAVSEQDRDVRESALVEAIADDCASIAAVIAAAEGRMLRRLADAWTLAQQQTSRIASADSRRRDMPLRCIAAQVAVELHLNDRTVQSRMYAAWRLVEHFPRTVDALEQGRISRAHAQVILETGSALEADDVRGAFEEVVLEWACGETVGRTRAYARQLAERLDPEPMDRRHERASEERSVTVVDLADGMSQIIALVPTLQAHGILDRLTRQAREVRTAEDATADRGGNDRPRTLDQVRADVFADLLLAGQPSIDPTDRMELPGGLGAIRAHVQITLPVTTLTGVTQGGAEIDGKAPIDPGAARRLAGVSRVWDRLLYHPVTAVVTAVDRYRPTPAQLRFIQARDRHCRFPGCRQPARRCQVDHNHERRDGGPTSIENLCCLCVRHHTMKTETDWTAVQRAGGRIEWTSPSARTYTDRPARVTFLPDLDPPPF